MALGVASGLAHSLGSGLAPGVALLALAVPCVLLALAGLLLLLRTRTGAPEPRPRTVWGLLCEVPPPAAEARPAGLPYTGGVEGE